MRIALIFQEGNGHIVIGSTLGKDPGGYLKENGKRNFRGMDYNKDNIAVRTFANVPQIFFENKLLTQNNFLLTV